MRCVGRVARIGEVGSMYVVGDAEVKGQLGRRWCKRLDGVAVGGVCLCSFVCLCVCTERYVRLLLEVMAPVKSFSSCCSAERLERNVQYKLFKELAVN